MKVLNFITSNQGKLDVLNQFAHEFSHDVKFEMLKMEFDELKLDDSLERTALNKARECIGLTDKDNVVVSDVGLFIDALKGFPGVNIGYTLKTIGNEGIMKLMKGHTDRSAKFGMAIAYVDKKGEEQVFSKYVDVRIAESIGGDKGFCWDFIALGDGERFSDNLDNPKRLLPF